MQGDASKVVMSKSSMVSTFDIVINTTKGALCSEVNEYQQRSPTPWPRQRRGNARDGTALRMAHPHFKNETMQTLYHRHGETKECK